MVNIATIGHLAAEPVERDTSTGGKFAAFPLATNDKGGTIYEVKTYKANDDTIKPQLTVTVDHFDFVSSKDKSNNNNETEIPF